MGGISKINKDRQESNEDSFYTSDRTDGIAAAPEQNGDVEKFFRPMKNHNVNTGRSKKSRFTGPN